MRQSPHDELQGMWDALRSADARPDDLTRARMAAGMEAALDAVDAERDRASIARFAGPRAKARVLAMGALVLLAAAVLVLAVLSGQGNDAGSVASVPADQGIVPYRLEGSGTYPIGQPVEVVSLASGMRMRARVGGRADVVLYGPATLRLIEHTEERTLVSLESPERGAMVVKHEPGTGPGLAIETRDARTTVANALAAVEASAKASTRVSVVRGSVVVQKTLLAASGSGRMDVSAAQSFRVDAPGPGAMDDTVLALFAEYEADAPRPDGISGVMRIDGTPAGAVAWLGDKRLGQIPLIAAVPAGKATVRVTAPGYEGVEMGAEVREGQISALAHVLSPSPLSAPPSPSLPAAEKAPEREAPASLPRSAERMASERLAPERMASERLAPERMASERLAPERMAPERVMPAQPAMERERGAAGERVSEAEAVYSEAEAAIARGDREAARVYLRDLIRRYPDDPVVDVALYELGRLAFAAGDFGEARLSLDRVSARAPAFAEPASYLRCRVDVASGADAIRCLREFRRRHPASSYDADVLALLLASHHAAGECDAVVALADEYLARYARGEFAAEAAERRQRCQAP